MRKWNASAWLQGEVEVAAPLDGELAVDVAVIGAGYTGLSTALALREAGLDVVVLEARTAGFGASGRNAGHLTPTIGKDLPTLALLFGRERTRALLAFAEAAIEHAEALIRDHAIACDYEPVGNVVAAVDERQFASIDRAARAAQRFDVPGQVLEPDQMRARGLPSAFLRGFLEPSGGVLDPARLCRGLRRAALAAGARLFEDTPVLRVSPSGARIAIRTPRGRVAARRLVIATNALGAGLDLRELGVRFPDILPIAVQLCRTAPLTAEQLAALPWRERQGVYTAHELLESYRLTADDRLVFGSKWIRASYGGAVMPDVAPSVCSRLEGLLRRRFPGLSVPITDHWGGTIAMSLDFLPQVGRAGPGGRVLYAAGYCGHGVAQATYAGRMLADLALEREGPGAAVWGRRSLPLPPEPLRWLIARGLIGLFGWMDHRVDGHLE